MSKSMPMSIGAMFVLLVCAIVLLPMFVHFINRNQPHFSISGFQNHDTGVKVPDMVSAFHKKPYVQDVNTDYMCRSPNDSGEPCSEKYFCSGVTQSCVPKYVEASGEIQGYYS